MSSLRAKLLAIVASTGLAFCVVLVTNMFVTRNVEERLVAIQEREIPRLELAPQLEANFADLKRAFQDAVAAHDEESLERTHELRDRILQTLERGRAVFDPATVDSFRTALSAYYDAALDIARRMMRGKADEDAISAMTAMQQRQASAQELLARLVNIDHHSLTTAFEGAYTTERQGAQRQVGIIVGCFALVLFLSLRNARHVARSLATLQAGFTRFAAGRLDEPIAATGDDEIGEVANEANRMAAKLATAASEREARDWVRSGLMDLGDDLRGELDEAQVATRATHMLARQIMAPAAALYVRAAEDPTKLVLLSHHALTPGEEKGDAAPSFTIGEGLVGEAARGTETVVVEAPADFLRVRSGLGDGPPRYLVFVPLVIDRAVVGVLELATFHPLSTQARELLGNAAQSVAIALSVARSRTATARLLAQTQRQAAQLLEQEEELKATNEELRCQQEELRQTNDELGSQRGALQQRNVELVEVGRRLEVKASELATVSAYKSQFLANMSHELRTPLNSMLLLSKLLEENGDGNLTAKQVEYARTVYGAGKDLLLLINQVLDLAKVEAGKQTVKIDRVRLADVAERMRRTFEPLAREKRIDFTIEIAAGLPEAIATDMQHLGQILTNLIGNAIKFTEKGGVELRIRRSGTDSRSALSPATSIAFAVVDSGLGIAPEHQGRVFEAFEQVDASAQRKQGGTGLGLGIARELAHLIGGELTLESRVGEGSTFTCLLPEHHAAQKGNGEPAATPKPAPSRAASASKLHLLVIEDDATFAEILGQIIRDRGLVHLVARDGNTGLRLAREQQPHGIILDVKLPDMDGWEVMRQLRADEATAAIPVHFISGVEMADRGIAMGAAGYLMKPAERGELIHVVESLGPKMDRTSYRVLVVERDDEIGAPLLEQLEAFGLATTRAASAEAALDILERETFACMIVDLAVDLHELELLEQVKTRAAERNREMPAVVVYTSRPLNRAEAARLESYAEAVVLKEGASTHRLLDEIRLFIRRLEGGLPRRQDAPKVRNVDVNLGGKKLLVADDDMRTVYALSAMLRARGAEVLTAETGAVALEALDRHPDVSAVLMDVMMPVMDGYEATRRIRAQARFEALPIIVLTAKAMKGDLERCLEAGATDYLPKPIDNDSLLTVLHTRLRAPVS